jgi:hypothetical protein
MPGQAEEGPLLPIPERDQSVAALAGHLVGEPLLDVCQVGGFFPDLDRDRFFVQTGMLSWRFGEEDAIAVGAKEASELVHVQPRSSRTTDSSRLLPTPLVAVTMFTARQPWAE